MHYMHMSEIREGGIAMKKKKNKCTYDLKNKGKVQNNH